jgi:hypothetical protein
MVGLVWLLLYAGRHRSILRTAGHIILLHGKFDLRLHRRFDFRLHKKFDLRLHGRIRL